MKLRVLGFIFCLKILVGAKENVTSHFDPESICQPNFQCDTDVEKYCRCDSLCEFYEDCCPDYYNRESLLPSLHYDFRNRDVSPEYPLPPLSRSMFECTSDNRLVVSNCPSSILVGSDQRKIKENCEQRHPDPTDPSSLQYVTDLRTNVTYKNRYCASCHNITGDDLKTWELLIDCKGLQTWNYHNVSDEEFLDHLIYIDEYKSWGVFDEVITTIHNCTIESVLPSEFEREKVPRKCLSNIVDTCNVSYSNREIVSKCVTGKYAPVLGFRAFKNIYCALCNEEDEKTLTCYKLSIYPASYAPSFTILLPSTFTPDGRQGRKLDCKNGKATFSGKCKAIKCPPNKVFTNGNCV